MSKGSGRRPTLISEDENTIRWQLAYGEITREEFDKKLKEIKNEN